MMRQAALAAIVICSFFTTTLLAQAPAAVADKIIGLYYTPQKDGKIEIYKRTDNKYYGKFTWGNRLRKDANNPDKALRNRDLLGLEFLTGFAYSNNYYTDGKIYDPDSGKTYSCKMWLEGNNLKVRGFIGVSLFGRTELFERIQ